MFITLLCDTSHNNTTRNIDIKCIFQIKHKKKYPDSFLNVHKKVICSGLVLNLGGL